MILPIAAQAEGLYVSGIGAFNFVPSFKDHHEKVKFDTGYMAGAAIGHQLQCNTRIEGELAYRHNQGKRTNEDENKKREKVDIFSAMVNGYYDIELGRYTCLKPYVGLGIGYAHCVSKDNYIFGDHAFAWQAMVGAAYPITRSVDLTVEYRYFKPNFKHDQNHNIGCGIRYWF